MDSKDLLNFVSLLYFVLIKTKLNNRVSSAQYDITYKPDPHATH